MLMPDQLTQRVRIVGVHAHHVAVRVRVEIADGQRLHVVEHILADVLQKALRHDRHRLVVESRRRQRYDVHEPHAADDESEIARYGAPGNAAHERGDDLVEHQHEEYGGADAGRRRHGDADKHGDHAPFVIMKQIGQKPAENFERMRFPSGRKGSIAAHCRRLPLCSGNSTLPGKSDCLSTAPRACRWR